MNHSLKITAMALCIAAACAGAQAQTMTGKARDDVRKELAEAQRDGTLLQGESGLPMRELFPGQYPQQPAVASRTRTEVTAELDSARRSGDLLASGDAALRLNELFPSRYPQRAMVAGKSRAQVLTELVEARRTGDIVATGESGLTLREIHRGAYPSAAMPVYAGAPASAADQSMH